MTNKHRVLIADDDKNLTRLLNVMLEDQFDLFFVDNGIDAEAQINQGNFDFVILDIHLPGKTGLELCEYIFNSETHSNLPVLILSADANHDTIRTAYQFGVSDYIVKPFNPVVFNEHIQRFSQDLQHVRQLEESGQQAQGLVQATMQQSAYYGHALDIMAALQTCHSEHALAKIVGQRLKNLNLHTAIQVRCDESLQHYDSENTTCSDIEVQVFGLLRERGRIYQFGRRAVFNDKNISLLVKVMPSKGSMVYDTVIDFLARLVPLLEAKLVAIQQHNLLQKTSVNLTAIMQTINQVIDSADRQMSAILDDVEEELREGFHTLELQEHQERFFIDLITRQLRAKLNGDQIERLREQISESLADIDTPAIEPHQNQVDADPLDIELF